MATTALPQGQIRSIRRPRRLDPRALVGLLLLLVAIAGSIAFWSASSETRAVLVATRDLPAGATLRATDLAVAHVRVDDAIYQAAVPAERLTDLIGRQLAEPAHTQQLLIQAQVSPRPPLSPDQLALTIPVSAATAAGGRIQPGDAVQVLVTTNKGKADSRTSVVLPRATVYEVGFEERLTVVKTSTSPDQEDRPTSQGTLSSLTLIVAQEQALQLAQAKWNGDLDVALLPAGE